MATAATCLVWFRLDLRLADNPALQAAADQGHGILPIYVLDDEAPGRWAMGGASRWWLHHSLASLAERIEERGGRLLLCRGPAAKILPRLARELGVRAVHWNRRYEPWAIARDRLIKRTLQDAGLEARSFNASLLHEPWEIASNRDRPYRVYTAFARACRRHGEPPAPLPLPADLRFARAAEGDLLDDWGLLPTKPDWAGGLRAAWSVGEPAARARLADFLDDHVGAYAEMRDLPGIRGTSRLSPHLHWGEIGPRTIWHALRHAAPQGGEGAGVFANEILWREFAHHLLWHFPDLPERPLDRAYESFPWREDPEHLRAWQRGRTGYPIVDAAMRELRSTGWMHNRARMAVGSFLVKDLLLPWQEGARWFWENLVDADLAANTLGWQWVAGCGPDAAPFFRIFNPVRQGERFDAEGAYVRSWLPELHRLDDRHLHAPFAAAASDLERAGIVLGEDYPTPLVDHGRARQRALEALKTIQNTRRNVSSKAISKRPDRH